MVYYDISIHIYTLSHLNNVKDVCSPLQHLSSLPGESRNHYLFFKLLKSMHYHCQASKNYALSLSIATLLCSITPDWLSPILL